MSFLVSFHVFILAKSLFSLKIEIAKPISFILFYFTCHSYTCNSIRNSWFCLNGSRWACTKKTCSAVIILNLTLFIRVTNGTVFRFKLIYVKLHWFYKGRSGALRLRYIILWSLFPLKQRLLDGLIVVITPNKQAVQLTLPRYVIE